MWTLTLGAEGRTKDVTRGAAECPTWDEAIRDAWGCLRGGPGSTGTCEEVTLRSENGVIVHLRTTDKVAWDRSRARPCEAIDRTRQGDDLY